MSDGPGVVTRAVERAAALAPAPPVAPNEAGTATGPRDFTVRYGTLGCIAGLVLIAGLCWQKAPASETVVSTVVAVLAMVVQSNMTGKFSLANPRNGGETAKVG